MNADDFRDYMLSFLFLRYLSDNYETAAKKELGRDYPILNGNGGKTPLSLWYLQNPDDVQEFEKQMRRKVHYVIERKEEIRYSRRVSMDEIEKNEFNLNISRYVSASLDEEIIDLNEVNEKLVDLEKQIIKARNTHNQYLKELGLLPI
ncbi:MAG: type I restriction-modification system subunit M N-terminal domain-containing protein [Bacteroidetes bacterium]|nr:type I restriction-modification system subunit M N-terminal domain-containing protein [Bacteroidota bacterium]